MVGAILLVAVVVLLSAVAATVIFGLADPPEAAPDAAFTYDGERDVIEYVAGDPLDVEKVTFLSEDGRVIGPGYNATRTSEIRIGDVVPAATADTESVMVVWNGGDSETLIQELEVDPHSYGAHEQIEDNVSNVAIDVPMDRDETTTIEEVYVDVPSDTGNRIDRLRNTGYVRPHDCTNDEGDGWRRDKPYCSVVHIQPNSPDGKVGFMNQSYLCSELGDGNECHIHLIDHTDDRGSHNRTPELAEIPPNTGVTVYLYQFRTAGGLSDGVGVNVAGETVEVTLVDVDGNTYTQVSEIKYEH